MIPRSRKPIARSPIRKRSRSKAEFARIYGSKARVEFVKSLPCSACGVVGYSENAHLLGNGGMSRKAGYETIGPLCGGPRITIVLTTGIGCHPLYDRVRDAFKARYPDFDPEKVAASTHAAFLAAQLEEK